jgi:tetratricopeptide (TPR) repeat protein
LEQDGFLIYIALFLLIFIAASALTWKLWFPVAFPVLEKTLENLRLRNRQASLCLFAARRFPGTFDNDTHLEKLCQYLDEELITPLQMTETLKTMLLHRPENPAALSMLADLYVQSGKKDKAFDIYASLLDIDPGDCETLDRYIELAVSMKGVKGTDKAIAHLEQIQEKYPENTALLKALGPLYQEAVNMNKITEIYGRLMDLEPSYLETYRVLAGIYSHKRIYSESFSLLKRLQTLDSTQISFVLTRIEKLLATESSNDNFTDSLEAFITDRDLLPETRKGLIKIFQNLAKDHPQRYHLFSLHLMNGDKPLAVAALRTAVSAFPNRQDLYSTLLDLQLQISDFEGMADTFRSFLQRNPSQNLAVIKRVQELLPTFDAPALKTLLVEILESDADSAGLMQALSDDNPEGIEDPEILKKMADLCIRRKDVSGAIKLYVRLVELGVDRTRNCEILGNLFLHSGQGKKAREYYDMIITEDSGNVAMAEKLAELCFLDGEHAQGAVYLTRVAEARSDDPVFLFRLGEALFMAGDHAGAINWLTRIPKLDSSMAPYAYNLLGHCNMHTNNVDRAKECFRAIDFRSPDLPDNVKSEFLLKMAGLFEERKLFVDALALAKKAISFNTSDPMAMDMVKRLGALEPRQAAPQQAPQNSPAAQNKQIQSLEEQLADRYTDISELGRGGMGIIYKAIDKKLNRQVALKVLPENLQADPEIFKRFLREAQAAASLNHPNIMQVFDVEEGKPTFIAMEFIDGENLREILRREKRMPVAAVVKMAIQTIQALDYAHSQGIVHRDIKPDNIMLNQAGDAKITDFGLAKIEYASTMTQIGVVMGTEWYMAPEQLRGLDADKRSDIYSFGITLYEILTGRPPFYKGDVAYQHINVDPPTPREKNDAIPEALDKIIMKCIAKKPERRFQNGRIIFDLLRKLS